MSDKRYHFMHKEKAFNTETIYQFMDFKGARLVRGTLKDFEESGDDKLKQDFRDQWGEIKRANLYNPNK